MKHTILVAIFVFASASAFAGTASAGGQPGSFGVGSEFQISGLGSLSVSYDGGIYHAGGFLGFRDPGGANNTTLNIGGRFFYHIASTAMSDFGVGGGLGIESFYIGADRQTALILEPSFQIRAFLASNVALAFTGGISIATLDSSEVDIGAQFVGAAGVHYYF